MHDPATNTDFERFQDLCESIGLDDYSLSYNREEVLANAIALLSVCHNHLRGSDRQIVAIKVTEHNRSYGNSTRYGLSITVSVPRPKHATRISTRRPKATGEPVAEATGGEGTEESAPRHTPNIPGLTQEHIGGSMVPCAVGETLGGAEAVALSEPGTGQSRRATRYKQSKPE